MVRVLGIGDNTVDIYVDQDVQFPGGNAVNVAVMMKRLGAEASYLGCIGTDFLGVARTLPGLGNVAEVVAWLNSAFEPATASALIDGNGLALLARMLGVRTL